MSPVERCPACQGTKFVVDSYAPDEQRCLNCSWHWVIADGARGAAVEISLAPQGRCAAPKIGGYHGQGAGERCQRPADGWGMLCRQHCDKHIYDWIYQNPEWQPGALRALFTRAAISAGIIAAADSDDDERLDALLAQAAGMAWDWRQDSVKKARSRQQVVYFCRRAGLVKIGTTQNIEKRMREISKGSSMPPGMTVGPVELLLTIPGGEEAEAKLHARFSAYRIPRTEWFEENEALTRRIDWLRERHRQDGAAA